MSTGNTRSAKCFGAQCRGMGGGRRQGSAACEENCLVREAASEPRPAGWEGTRPGRSGDRDSESKALGCEELRVV